MSANLNTGVRVQDKLPEQSGVLRRQAERASTCFHTNATKTGRQEPES